MIISTEMVGLAGEYAVAAELCRRGAYCQLTFGNRKKTDILVDTKDGLFRVSVKAKQKKSWARVKGIWQEGDLLVFVDYEIKEIGTPPDFYVLDVHAWKKIVTRKKKNDPRATIDNENTLVWSTPEGQTKSWVGCEVSLSDVEEFKDAWPTFKPPTDVS